MFALGRLLVIGFLVLSVVYICLSLYSRAVRKDKLEAEWDEEIREGDREAFVKAGLEEYDGSLRRKLILGVYVVPLSLMTAIIYFTNFH
jgi:Ca2+/Na+ antiporter